MDKSLDSYTRLAVILVLVTVLTIGGLSLFMAKTMRDKTYLIEAESRNISLVNRIQAKTNKLIFALQMFILQPDAEYDRRVRELYNLIAPELHAYITYEKAAEYPEAAEEVKRLEMIDHKLHDIMKIHDELRVGEFHPGQLRRLDQYVASIEQLTTEINELHFTIIDRKIAKANRRLQLIALIYGFCALAGLILFFALYKLYSRSVVTPIKVLAGATRRLAGGERGLRVPVESRTEIGLLYHSFNSMAAQIQANESRLHQFNRELDEQVQQRTAELREAQDELLRLERLATLGQIASSVNHEIKTPLNALSMNLQLLKKDLTQGVEPGATIALLEGEINRISDLLDEFVNYARFAPPRLQPADLNALINSVAEMLDERASRSGVRIKVVLAPELPPLKLDENKMIQALINLGMNAIEALTAGGELTFATLLRDREVRLSIHDSGGGIDPADQARIFEPFFSRKPLGMGFGLAIVQKIIEEHGGRISCTSAPEPGTTFTIQLPLPEPPSLSRSEGP